MEPQPGDLPQGLEIFMNILFFSIPFVVLLFAYITGKITEDDLYANLDPKRGQKPRPKSAKPKKK